jgi:C-terminal processing protease CtpA/Prc
MKNHPVFLRIIILFLLPILACQVLVTPTLTPTPSPVSPPTRRPSPLPTVLVTSGEPNPDEPVLITGEIRYTSPFFLNTISQSMVLLEDEAGFVHRDRQFQFPKESQVIGPVEVHDDQSLTYSLTLPAVPLGTQVDVDPDGVQEIGVQVFALAYWSNTWGDPFLEERDAHGWSTAYASTKVDPEKNDEIVGGILIVWAPDAEQSFPSGFGKDGLLFTDDDPTAPIASGYNLVDLDQAPFRVHKEPHPAIQLNEGVVAVSDFSSLSYRDAFKAMFDKVSVEYPFTTEKNIDWGALDAQFSPRAARVSNDDDFYRVVRDFSLQIPDEHVNVSLNAQVFYEESGGSFGLVLAELSDGRVIVSQVVPGTPGSRAGIQPGGEIISWDGMAVSEAISRVVPKFSPFSTEHTRRLSQLVFLTRVPPGTTIEISYQDPDASQPRSITLKAEVEYDSLFRTFPSYNRDQISLPLDGEVLDDSKLGYLRVYTFSTDYQLLTRLWEYYLQGLLDNKVPGLIIDLRANSGGATEIALDFAGYIHKDKIELYQESYFNQETGKFEPSGEPSEIEPGPIHFDGPVAVLIGPDCVSACEAFAYALAYGGRSILVGHYPTAGAFGEVGRGQYKLPGDIDVQFPTGRATSPDGKLMIEGTGVIPDILVPVTVDSALGKVDVVLQAAVQALLDQINKK